MFFYALICIYLVLIMHILMGNINRLLHICCWLWTFLCFAFNFSNPHLHHTDFGLKQFLLINIDGNGVKKKKNKPKTQINNKIRGVKERELFFSFSFFFFSFHNFFSLFFFFFFYWFFVFFIFYFFFFFSNFDFN